MEVTSISLNLFRVAQSSLSSTGPLEEAGLPAYLGALVLAATVGVVTLVLKHALRRLAPGGRVQRHAEKYFLLHRASGETWGPMSRSQARGHLGYIGEHEFRLVSQSQLQALKQQKAAADCQLAELPA